jgi:hypothetical protein
MSPLELLESERDKWMKALRKSKEAFEQDKIPENVYKDHKENLEPKIQEYKDAVETLKIFGK